MTEPVGPGPGTPPNRLPLIVGGGVGAIALIFVVTQVLGGDDDTEPAETTTDTTVFVAPAPPVATTLPPSGAPVETFEVFSTKNPFVPLRGAATAATGGTTAGGTTTGGTTTGGTTTGGATTGGTTAGGTTTGGTTSGTGASGGSTGGSTEPRRGSRVALLDVFAEAGKTVANVRVNDTVYKVSEGEVFATSFKVVSLSQSDRCGRFVFGDDSFRLCRGEESLK